MRLIREEIETSYRYKLKNVLEEIKILEGNADKKFVYSHRNFVEPMLDYIIKDFEMTRIANNNSKIGGMVVCDSSNQARKMYEIFQEKYFIDELPNENSKYSKKIFRVKSSAVILHDEGTKEIREDLIEGFKSGEIDFLFVYNMLLTGFDSPNLKKIYLGRVIKSHNLLQTLTRVNRPFEKLEYGYVVDFADIEKEFEKTNRNYFEELQNELGDETETYSNLFKSNKEIEDEIDLINRELFNYDINNAEIFSSQISEITNKKELITIVKALDNVGTL